MIVRSCLLALALFACFIPPLIAEESPVLRVGATYEEVVALLGPPDGDVDAGNRRLLSYGNARLRLVDGALVSIPADIEQLLKEREAAREKLEANREAGLVEHRGQWVTTARRDALIREENQARQRAQAEANARAQRAQPASAVPWQTNFDQALDEAKRTRKRLLINFTGSDWCGWCIRLDREVFAQPEFLNQAREQYVFLKIDFPRRTPLPPDIRRQNDALAGRFGVRGYPTVIVLDANGRLHKRSGYVAGGPEPFLRSLR